MIVELQRMIGRMPTIFVLVMMTLAACMTPQKRKQMDEDIFSLKARVMELEKTLGTGGKTIKTADAKNKKNLAAVNAETEKQKIEIQKLKGEIDRLRVGVVTGELPGSESDQDSIAKTLSSIVTRLETVEANQNEILTALKKTEAKGNAKSTKIKTVKGLRSAFQKKSFVKVTENAPAILKRLKTRKSREEVLYMHAESLYKLGKMRDAALKFNDYIDINPAAKKVPHAKMRMGDCFRHLGDKATARLYYQELVDKFPKSEQATKAKTRLVELGKSAKSAKSRKRRKRYTSYDKKPRSAAKPRNRKG